MTKGLVVMNLTKPGWKEQISDQYRKGKPDQRSGQVSLSAEITGGNQLTY